MSRRRRRADRKRQKDVLGAGLIVGALVLLGAVGFAATRFRTPEFDAESLCLKDAFPPAHTLILVDATDALDVRHLRRLQSVARQEAARLPRWGRLTVESLSPDGSRAPSMIFSACTPGDRTSANALWENVAHLEALKRERFDGALDAALAGRGRGAHADASPIVEGLAAAVDDPVFQGPSRRLVLVSDLLEFIPGRFSAYAPGAGWASYLASPGALRGPPDLSTVTVRVVMLERPNRGEAQTSARERFWRPFFEAAGARTITWET